RWPATRTLIEHGLAEEATRALVGLAADGNVDREQRLAASRRLFDLGEVEQATARLMALALDADAPTRLDVAKFLVDHGQRSSAAQIATWITWDDLLASSRAALVNLIESLGERDRAIALRRRASSEALAASVTRSGDPLDLRKLREAALIAYQAGETESGSRALLAGAATSDTDVVERLRPLELVAMHDPAERPNALSAAARLIEDPSLDYDGRARGWYRLKALAAGENWSWAGA